MKKKVLSLLLAATMIISLVACGGSEDAGNNSSSATSTDSSGGSVTGTSEEYKLETLTIVVNGTVVQTDANQKAFEEQWEAAIEEKMGYKVDLIIKQLDHSGYYDAIGRMFVGGEYPDALLMSADLVKQYSTSGILWDMAEAYENAEFQARMQLPAINENMKDSQGRLYCFAPTYGNGCVTYVKKAWLDAVGMNADDIKTFDDYYNMLLAFHNGDPDGDGVKGNTFGTIAAGYLGTETPYINYLPEFWQDAYPAIRQDENGVWYDGFNTEATKAALLRLQKGAAEGAIDPETFTATTKIAREKWFSNIQAGSSGVFTYWAGTWYQNLTNNLIKNGIDEEVVMLKPIEEVAAVGGYLNREAGGWSIIDDGDGNDAREQAVFDILIETMLDGDKIQTLWTYGAEDVHWSTHAETFTTNAGTEKEKVYEYKEGQFHLRQNPSDPNSIWSKNHIDNALVVSPLVNGYVDTVELVVEGNKFFTSNCVDAPLSPSSETYANEAGVIHDAKMEVVSAVIMKGEDVDSAMQKYVDTVGAIIEQCLAELNAQ